MAVNSIEIVKSNEIKQPIEKARVKFRADMTDFKLSIIMACIGFLFIRWVFFVWRGYGVALFTVLFCVTAILYFVKKERFQTKSGLFSFAVVMYVGISYGVYENAGLKPWTNLFLLASAAYAVTASSGRLIGGQTGKWLMVDGFISLIRTPFKHFSLQIRTIAQFANQRDKNYKPFLSALMAFAITLILFSIIIPLLLSADSGSFGILLESISIHFEWFREDAAINVINAIMAIPVSFYLFGLIAGSHYWHEGAHLKEDTLMKHYQKLKAVPQMTTFMTLVMLIILYSVFIGSQLPYYFSAFLGKLPDGVQIYSEYARKGFFELVKIACINLIVVLLANLFSKVTQTRIKVIKGFNVAMALITLIFIATALSKMVLYINVYGLSMMRLLPCIFMIWLLGIWIGVIVIQWHAFDLVRVSVLSGVLLFCALVSSNPDYWVLTYNAERYQAGTLERFDVTMLYRSSAAGVTTAMQLLDSTEDVYLKRELLNYIFDESQALKDTGFFQMTLEGMLANQKLLRVDDF